MNCNEPLHGCVDDFRFTELGVFDHLLQCICDFFLKLNVKLNSRAFEWVIFFHNWARLRRFQHPVNEFH